MRASILLLSAGLLGQTPGREAHPSGPLVESARLLEDVEVLGRVYEAAHPGLYRYNTRGEIEGHLDVLRAEFARDRTLAESFVAISQFLAKIRCGHTFANFVNQPKGVAQALFAGKNRVPFCFRWVGGRMIVTRDLSGSGALGPGTEILSIQGVRAPEILGKLLTIARADGGNDAKRIASLEVQGVARYEAFDVFLPLVFPAIGGRMDLVVRAPSAKDSTAVTVDAQTPADRQRLAQASQGPGPGGDGPLWKFERLDDRTAYLRMPSWALYNSKWDWSSFLDRGFDDLVDGGVAALILDLRGNEGGLDVGNRILSRITPGEVRLDRYRRYTRYRALSLPAPIDRCLETWDKSFKDWGEAAREDRDGFFRMTKFDDDPKGDRIAPTGRRFGGRVVALIDASNSSATFQFAQVLKDQKLGTLVGRPTGGNQRGINGGGFFFVTLPNSRIEVDLPLIATFAGGPPWPNGSAIPFREIPDSGIAPDLAVEVSVEEIARGVDGDLKAARALLGVRP